MGKFNWVRVAQTQYDRVNVGEWFCLWKHRTHFQSSSVQPEASLQPRVCRGSPSRRSCLLPPLCLGHAAVCVVRSWQLIASSVMAEPTEQKHHFGLLAQSQELLSWFLCAGGRESTNRASDTAPSLLHPWQLWHYKEPSTSTCRCQPLPGAQRL